MSQWQPTPEQRNVAKGLAGAWELRKHSAHRPIRFCDLTPELRARVLDKYESLKNADSDIQIRVDGRLALRNYINRGGTAVNLDELEAAARAARPGPWGSTWAPAATGMGEHVVTAHQRMHGHICPLAVQLTTQDARYIAAANPETILDLIARLRAAEALYDAAATFKDATLWGGAGIDSDELTRALRAYDALGGSK